jgi:acetyl-CoA C-acetyltransferase
MGAVIGSEPLIMLEGPIRPPKKALRKANMNVGDIDIFEVNEALQSFLRLMDHHLKVDHSYSKR